MDRRSRRARAGLVGAGLLGLLPGATPAKADETPFASIYTAETMEEGEVELEQWFDYAAVKPDERFRELEGRTELGFGISDRFSLSLYANYRWADVAPRSGAAPDDPEHGASFSSVSGEAIYSVLDPDAAPIGVALYFEPSIGADERSAEFKLLLQKDFFDERLVLAANVNLEYHWARDPATRNWDHETALEFYLGASYRIAPQWRLGAELLNENGYSGHIFAGARAETIAFYAGPTIHYDGNEWWATLGLLEQLPWAGNPGGLAGAVSSGFLNGAERFRLRLRIGTEF